MLKGSSKRKYLQILLALFIIIWVALAINPVYRFDWFLENILVFIAVPFTLYIHKKSPLSTLSYTLIFIFLVIHCYGAHYTYSETPLGKYVSDALGFERNHYDRFVHFMWGFMLTIPVFELLQKRISRRKVKTIFIFACSILLSFGVAYEFMEWWTAILVAPEAGTAFLGTQGDEWDAQKDLLLGLLGSIASMVFLPLLYKFNIFAKYLIIILTDKAIFPYEPYLCNDNLLTKNVYNEKLSLLVFLAFGFFASYGQATFTVDHTLLELPNPSNTAFEQILLTHVKNTSATAVTFRWTRITECLNTGYSTSVCIGGLCFLNTLNTKTFTLEPGGETELSLHMWKDGDGTPGAKAKVTIKEEGNDANIKEVQFVFGVCASSTFSPELAQSTVFPNPSSDYFKVQTIAPADMIRVVDMQGRTVLTFDYEEGRQYPIQQLATGNYLLMIENSTEKKVWYSAISKELT